VKQLRDITDPNLLSSLPQLYQKRARHVVTENKRVLEAVEALENGDMFRLGKLMQESHHSMRDDYEVSVPEIDILVEESLREPGVFGARLTGGGFGGSIVGICEPKKALLVAQHIVERARRRSLSRKVSKEQSLLSPGAKLAGIAGAAFMSGLHHPVLDKFCERIRCHPCMRHLQDFQYVFFTARDYICKIILKDSLHGLLDPWRSIIVQDHHPIRWFNKIG
jgi:hypothetical protein